MLRIYLWASIFLAVLGCSNKEPEKVVEAKHPPTYYFYPKANVYFDTVNKEYVFLANDGKSWQAQKQIPAAMQVMMDKSILIDSPSVPVWKDNENHRLIYSAKLYVSPADKVEKPEPRPVVQ